MSQQVKDIENALTNVYIKIFREIKKDAAYPLDMAALQLTFNKLVYDNTRSAVEQAVLKGSQKVNRKLKTQPFISQTDLDLIKKKTDEQVASFWRKLQLDMNREQENITLAETNNELKPRLDTNSFLNAVATTAAFASFALATTSKLRELEPEKAKVKWVSVLDSKTCTELSDGSEGCKQRNGRIYEADDFELQQHPPGELHSWCRCTVEPIV
jgi:hypothetical protein